MKLPKLHLRDLFWLVLVCGVVMAWWLSDRRRLQQIKELETELSHWVEW